jgi:hypothetical protein
MTRWMYPHELEGQGERDAFDPIVEGARYRLSPELSLAIWDRVRRDATDSTGRIDPEQAVQRFHEIAARIAARGGRLTPDIGRLTRVGVELDGGSLERWRVDEMASHTPGRTTQVIAEAERWNQLDGEPAAARDDAGASADHAALPRAREVAEAVAAMQAPEATRATAEVQAPPLATHVARRAAEEGPVRLPMAMLDRMERLFGHPFGDVELHANSAEVATGQQAFTRAQQIHLERGVDLESGRGALVVAHELAHVVQQHGGGERPGTRSQLEREAQRAASLAAQGQPARIALRARPADAYAFSEDSGREEDVTSDAGDAGHSDDAGHADHDPHEAKGDAGEAHTHDAVPSEAATPQSAAEPAGHDDATGGQAEENIDTNLGVIPAEGGDAGAPSIGGGGGAARPKKEPPNVAAARPEAGLAQLHGVRPDTLSLVFGQVRIAAGADAAKERAKQKAHPPKQMSTGSAAGPAGGKGKDGGLGVDGARSGTKGAKDGAEPASSSKQDAKAGAERPLKGEVPDGEAAKKAQQGQARDQQQTAGQAISQAAHSNHSFFTSRWPARGGGSTNGNATAVSDAEAQNMAGSVNKLSTNARVSTDAGPPPEIVMKGEAKSSADRDRARLESKTAAQEAQGRTDAAAPMGEDHIETTVAAEELSAKPMPGGEAAGPGASLPTLAGAAPSEEAGIVAQEQSGAEIDAALSKASTDVTAERGKQSTEEARARADSDRQITELKSRSEADQAAARTAAQAEVQASRTQWKSQIHARGADARKQADKKISEGMTQVEAEETKANAEARQHIDEGKKKAEEEKQKGEKEAADAKEKGKEKSSGFFGWLADKAKAAFDGIKQAVSAAIDACRRAVKAVIDAAKQLAMAAIELARKAITAAIKAIGAALIAISDVLLAAFPELKARFQAAIRKAVDKAVGAVNKLVDALKQGVQKALDLLGAALDKALSLLEKGIHAIVDAANAVVQGAIKAAQAIVEALGTWARLLKDVASGPGAWIAKLGAAVIDGIKNHLWAAFKTAAVEWFKGKVFELLGIGGIILELLLEGGLTREHIIQMALDALMVAIPAALVAILIEKLVSMIVPAAGAVMAIIEGLQAAWGTISRIIAAFAAFMAFLLAVKGGGAGALFAAVVASAAVVVLDFVANWLLKKLMSAARKVGAKLKGLAEKFKAKRKAKKDAKAAKNHHDEHDVPGGKKHKAHNEQDAKAAQEDKSQDGKEKSKQEKRKEEIQKRIEKAERELPPKIIGLISKRPSKLRVRAQFAIWKLTYKLSRLELTKGASGVGHIEAQVNPKINLGSADKVYEFEWSEIAPIFHRVAAKYVGQATLGTDASGAFQYQSRPQRTDASLEPQGKYSTGAHDDGSPAGFEVREKEKGFPFPLKGKVAEVRPVGADMGRMYPAVARDLEGVDKQALGRYLKAKMRGEPRLPSLGGREAVADELFGMWSFEPGHPRKLTKTPPDTPNHYTPTFGHQRDWTYAMMSADLLADGHMSVQDAIMKHPAQGGGAQPGAKLVTAVDVHHTQPEPTSGNDKEQYDKRVKKEIELVEAWVRAKSSGPSVELWGTKPTIPQIEAWVEKQIIEFRGY